MTLLALLITIASGHVFNHSLHFQASFRQPKPLAKGDMNKVVKSPRSDYKPGFKLLQY